MSITALSPDKVLQLLHEDGLRITGPRRTIVDVVLGLERLFTAEELLGLVRQADQRIGRATVFRTLEVMVRLGVVDRVHQPDNCHSYVVGQGQERHYHHLICSACGITVPFEGCTVDPLLADLREHTDFEISGHMLEVFGICAECRNEPELDAALAV